MKITIELSTTHVTADEQQMLRALLDSMVSVSASGACTGMTGQFPPLPLPEIPEPDPGMVERMIIDAAVSAGHIDLPVSSDDVDSEGTSYDPEIHSSTRAKTSDGKWRKRRAASFPPPPSAPAAAPAPEPVEDAPPLTGMSVMLYATQQVKAGKLTRAESEALADAAGIPSLPAVLKATPEQLAAFRKALAEQVGE